jgi:carbon storage regulator
MLVVSRAVGEAIVIGDDIRVMITHIGSGKVRLGIEAPRDVPVHREEVYEAIQADRQQSAEAACEFDDGGPTREDLGID